MTKTAKLPRVLIFGATGMMGSRIVAMLRETLPRERVIEISRTGAVRGDITSPETIELHHGDVVIDVVGPYLHDPAPIVRHCLENGAHYIDLAESFDFQDRARQTLDAFEQVRPATSALVPGCSTVPAMADVLVPDSDDCTREILLSVGSRNKISAALMFGLLQPLGRSHDRGRWWHVSVSRTLLSGQKRRYGSFPSPNRDGRTNFYCGLDYRIGYWALLALSVGTRRLEKTTLLTLCERVLPVARWGRFLGTPKGSLRLERYRAGHLEQLIEIRAASNGLAIPAVPAVWAALALLERPDVAGITDLSALISSEDIVADLRARGYEVESESPAIARRT